MSRYVALLRAINVGKRQVPMSDLKALANELGLANARTYLASGNLLFETDKPPAWAETQLEAALEQRFGFNVEVMVRSQAQWADYARGNPMPRESEASPNLVMISVGKRDATDADLTQLRKKAGSNERVERVGPNIWLFFGDGAGRSKLGLGPKTEVRTTRNWRSIIKINQLLGNEE